MVYKDRDKLIVKAKKLRKEGLSWQKIADKLGVKKGETVQYWLDPVVRKKINMRNNKYQSEHRNEHSAYSKNRYQGHRSEYIARAKKWHQENPERVREIKVTYRETHREGLREKGKEYDAAHRAERSAYAQRWQKANPERYQATLERYRDNHREEINACAKQRRIENPEKFRAIQHKYRINHRDVCRAHKRLREAKIKEYNKISQAEYDTVLKRQEGLCIYCDKIMLTTGDPNHPDYKTQEHIFPISRGGPHSLDNFAYACRKCNVSKHTKTVSEWRPELLAKVGNGVRNKE